MFLTLFLRPSVEMEAQRSRAAAHDQRIVSGQPASFRPAARRTVPPPGDQPILGAAAGHLTLRAGREGGERGGV